MKTNKLFCSVFMCLCLFFYPLKIDDIYHYSNYNEINNVFMSIKYADSSSGVSNNLYSSSIDYNDISSFGYKVMSLPSIMSSISYDSKTYSLVGTDLVDTVTIPNSSLSRGNYVATYVYISNTPNIYTESYYNEGDLTSIFHEYEVTNSFSIDTSISTEVGSGAEEFGFGASAGITSYINTSVGYGAGLSATIEYDFADDAIDIGKTYSIQTSTYYIEFISILYEASYSSTVYWWQWWNTYYDWNDYINYAFLTTEISVSFYNLLVF